MGSNDEELDELDEDELEELDELELIDDDEDEDEDDELDDVDDTGELDEDDELLMLDVVDDCETLLDMLLTFPVAADELAGVATCEPLQAAILKLARQSMIRIA